MAWPFRSGFWAKPSRLEQPCTICARPIPCDPTNPLCAHCSYQANNDMARISNNAMSTSLTPNSYPPSPTYSPMTSATSLKRYADPPLVGEPPTKRTFSNSYSGFRNPLIRRTVVGPIAQTHASTPAFVDAEAEDDLQDAHEELPSQACAQYTDGQSAFTIGQSNSDYISGGKMLDVVADMNNGGMMEIDEDVEEEEPDLFHSTFGRHRSQDSDDEEIESAGSNEDDEDKNATDTEENAMPMAEEAADMASKDSLTYQNITNLGLASEIKVGSTPSFSTAPQVVGPRPPDPEKDLSYNLRELTKFKDRAVELIPQLPLGNHRYWIGVLHENVKAKTMKNETDFIWMKGNRLTTVSTVWHTYSTTTASEDFVLLLGYEMPEFDVRMEELDYFNEKKIIFRAVNEKLPHAKGRKMCEGIIGAEVVQQPEVIVLD